MRMRRGRDLLQNYLDDTLEFDGFKVFGLKPMASSGVKKDSLRGQKLNIEVFEIRFPDGRGNTYAWGIDGKIIAAGSMPKAYELVDDVLETYRYGKPEHIFLHFPKTVPPTFNMTNGNGHVLPVSPSEMFDFKRSIENFKIVSIANEASAS